MDIMHLRYFQAAAKTQKFTQAAEQMHISQPAFSASLSKLEKELGVHLFDRIGRRIQLNEYGKIYIRYVDQALAALDEGGQKLAEATTEKKRRFSLGTVSMRMIQEVLSDFQIAYPNIIVRRYEIMPKDVYSELNDSGGGSDIIVTASPGELENAPGCRVIKREPLFVAVSKRHPLAGREEIFLSEGGRRVFAPKVEGFDIEFYEIHSLDDLRPGYQGIREPEADEENRFTHRLYEEKNCILLLPGSVYDRELGRMGYGKGFYDRFLHKFPKLTSAGLAFDCQIAKAVPVDEKDERVDMIVTETEIIRMAGREKE